MSNTNYEINQRLKHLSEEQINELIKRYYNNEKSSTLIDEYKIDIKPGQLYTLFLPEICEDKSCPKCNVPLIINRKSKSGYSTKGIAYCPICGHTDEPNCKCDLCSERREREKLAALKLKREQDEQKRKRIEEVYALCNEVPIELESLTFRDKLYIGALLRLSLSEDMQYIQAVEDAYTILAPNHEMARDILHSLYVKKIIIVHPNSNIEAFPSREGDEFPYTFHRYKVNYYLNVGESAQREKTLQFLMNPPNVDSYDNIITYSIWKELALAECIQYLNYQMEKVNFEFSAGEKTISIFSNFLDNFSVSEIYGIIYKGITSATRYYQESNVNRRQAANSVIGSCERYAEKVLINKWEISKFRRDTNLPQTIISEFFFNKLLKIGDDGFYSVPRKL